MNAIVIMAREPKPNKVKTRLTPPLDPQTASKIYHGFLLDRIEQVESLREVDHFVAITPESSDSFFKDIIPKDFALLRQKGKDLGERLSDISNTLFKKGYEKVVMMDSDSPNLPSRYISEGLKMLNKADLVLGPCEDGGYYLIGLSSNMPQIFQDIPWSTSRVTEITNKKAKALGKKISLLEEWYDVDTFEDLKRMRTELDSYPKAPNDIFFCKNTYSIISEIL
ncbi:MAG: TIGR04282 family arsenosugar biosynthesis glycosyltransferase [Thermoplasmata archaeon]|nr:MAG: TIGR04282 family arsenosugar biosynthesis glycosyltransferase [Thermoplasmata archaeon]